MENNNDKSKYIRKGIEIENTSIQVVTWQGIKKVRKDKVFEINFKCANGATFFYGLN